MRATYLDDGHHIASCFAKFGHVHVEMIQLVSLRFGEDESGSLAHSKDAPQVGCRVERRIWGLREGDVGDGSIGRWIAIHDMSWRCAWGLGGMRWLCGDWLSIGLLPAEQTHCDQLLSSQRSVWYTLEYAVGMPANLKMSLLHFVLCLWRG